MNIAKKDLIRFLSKNACLDKDKLDKFANIKVETILLEEISTFNENKAIEITGKSLTENIKYSKTILDINNDVLGFI